METEKVLNRKKELIKRDPLFRRVSETFQKIRQSGERPLSIEEAVRDICSNLKTGEDYFAKYQAKYPGYRELELLAGSISAKWQVFLRFDFNSPDGILITPLGIYNETIFVGSPSIDRHPEMNWTPYPNHLNREPIVADIHTMLNQAYDGKKERWFSILINVDRIKAEEIENFIREIIKPYLKKGRTKKPVGEYPECEPLYSMDEETFQNYLRCYDLYTGLSKVPSISFRAIAWLEEQEKFKDMDAQEIIAIITRNPDFQFPELNKVESESTVAKGIRKINQIISRKSLGLSPGRKKDTQKPLPMFRKRVGMWETESRPTGGGRQTPKRQTIEDQEEESHLKTSFFKSRK